MSESKNKVEKGRCGVICVLIYIHKNFAKFPLWAHKNVFIRHTCTLAWYGRKLNHISKILRCLRNSPALLITFSLPFMMWVMYDAYTNVSKTALCYVADQSQKSLFPIPQLYTNFVVFTVFSWGPENYWFWSSE